MASYQMGPRDPLLDRNTQAMVERRGKELVGIALLALALLLAVMLGSHSPDDPGWMVATEEPARNMMGRFGAAVSSTLLIILGQASWALPVLAGVWGLRFVMHRGADRALSRLIFGWTMVVSAAAYASTLVPSDTWVHSFGLGGLLGDTLIGAWMGMTPMDLGTALTLSSLASFAALVATSLFSMGVNREELRTFARVSYVGAATLRGRLMGGVRQAGAEVGRRSAGLEAGLRERAASRADARAAARPAGRAQPAPLPVDPRTDRHDPLFEDAPAHQAGGFDAPPVYGHVSGRMRAEPVMTDTGISAPSALPVAPVAPVAPVVAAPTGLRARVEGFIRRAPDPEPRSAPEPELVERPAPSGSIEAPSADRIRSRISDAIEARAREQAAAQAQTMARGPGRLEPPLHRGARPDVPVVPAVSRAVAAAQARAAAQVPEAPMRYAVLPGEPEDLSIPPLPPMAASPRAASPVAAPAPVAAPRVHAPAPAPVSAPIPAPRRAPPEELVLTSPDDDEDDLDLMEPVAPLAPRVRASEALDWAREWDEGADAVHEPAPYLGIDQSQHARQALVRRTGEGLHGDSFTADDADEAFDDRWVAPVAAPVVRPAAPSVAAPPPVHAPRIAPMPPMPPSRPAAVQAAPQVRPMLGGQGGRPAPAPQVLTWPDYEAPPLALLADPDAIERHHLSDEQLEDNARMLENVLDDYGVKGEIVSVRPGPVVTMYELEPAPGLKASRVIGLADDIARSMSALSARVSTVPGRSVIGIELPNSWREKVVLREILTARDFGDNAMRLPLALGKDIGGDPVVANLAKMPHLLIAGTTGSGKSVAINTMILSLLYKLTPEECRLIMIDPKMLELSVYDGIPHLLSPVVTDPKKAVVALKWVVGEMEERYRKMSKMGVRNIEGYNGRVREALSRGEMFKRTIQTGFDEDTGEPVFETEEFAPQTFPYIVVIVDEMADLMMVAGKEIEACIQRLAQMARASGIHLIMATQRPSVDVITGTIKANFPTRISFQVTSKIDSRTILGEMGAEQLLGMGDMLYMAGGGRISRIHGPFVSDEEVEEVVSHLKSFGPPQYMSGVVEGPDDERADDIDAVLGLGGGENSEDALYDQAVAIVARDRKCSTSYIQRKLGIGYQKAARLVEQMEDQGVVSTANHVGKREILLPEH